MMNESDIEKIKENIDRCMKINDWLLYACQKYHNALTSVLWLNPLKNDRDAFMLELCLWGLLQDRKKPNPADYGQELGDSDQMDRYMLALLLSEREE